MASATDQFWQLPPVSRTIVALTGLESILVHGGILSPYRIVFYYPWLAKLPPQIWRLVTPFFLTGPNLSIIFDLYFMWTYSSACETQSQRFSQPGEYFTFLVFVATVILLLAGFVLSNTVFTSALVLSLAYIYAQDNRNRRVGFFIFQIPAQYLPWAMLLMTFVMGGPGAAIREGTGLVAAHLYDFLTRIYPTFQGGRNWIQTPRIVRSWFGGDQASWQQRAYGSSFRPGAGNQQQGGGSGGATGSSSGWSNSLGGVVGNSWRSRGTGRRLGGD